MLSQHDKNIQKSILLPEAMKSDYLTHNVTSLLIW